MAKQAFNLGDSLAGILGSVSPSDTMEQIELVSINLIDRDERNFYSVEGIEELASNIATVGLLDPLRLRPNDARFTVVSGHRRLAALWLLYKEDPAKWQNIPAIVERTEASAELQELRLIMANADTRRMSSADMAKQAERVEMLLYELKEQGYEFPGRMRDHVAEACKVSATKLAELKVIREKLAQPWRGMWERNEIAHSVAYALAKETPAIQQEIYRLHKRPEGAYEYSVKDRAEKIKKAAAKTCDKCEDGKCAFAMRTLEIEYLSTSYHSCSSYSCCENCYNFESCRNVCPLLKEKQAERTKDKKEAAKAQREAEKLRDNAQIEAMKGIWRRFGERRRAAGLTVQDCVKAVDGTVYTWKNYAEDEERETGGGKWTPSQSAPWGWSKIEDIERIVKTADALHCSTDYLLGRTDEPAPWTGAWISVDDRYPEEGEYCLVCTASRVVLPAVYFRASFMDFTEKSVGNVRIPRVEHWMPLPKAPGKFKYMGQETLDSLTNRG